MNGVEYTSWEQLPDSTTVSSSYSVDGTVYASAADDASSRWWRRGH